MSAECLMLLYHVSVHYDIFEVLVWCFFYAGGSLYKVKWVNYCYLLLDSQACPLDPIDLSTEFSHSHYCRDDDLISLQIEPHRCVASIFGKQYS